MKRIFQFTVLLLLYAPLAFAQGTCPANLPVSGTNCFFIAASGLDSNNGTSESTPWLHAPGMPNCTGTCASTTPAAGEGFIFRGGDIWHLANSSPSSGVYTGGTWVWQWSGGSSNCNYEGGSTSTCIYIGTDPTWYTGGSFARPALDWDNPTSTSLVASCSYADLTGLDIGNSSFRNVDYVTFDDFAFYGKCSQSVNPANWVFYWGNYITFSHLYVHGWTEVTGDNTSCCEDEMPILEGSNGITQPTHDIVTYDVFDGSDSYCTGVNACSGGPILYNDQYEMDHSICRYMSNCIAGGAQDMTTFHDNLIEYVYESWDPYTHSNILEMNGTPVSGWVTSVYNNIVRHTSVGITFDLWLVHGSSGYFFNNTLFDVAGGGNCVQIENDYGTGASTFYFTNNTIDHTTSICSIRPTPNSGQGWNGTTYFQNNHMVAITSLSQVESSCPSGSTCTWTDNGNEVFQTESVANGQGYTSSNNYQPTSTSVATYHAGGNLSSSCSTYSSDSALCKGSTGGVTNTAGSGVVPTLYIASPSSRNSTWDAGAYQYQASGPSIGGITTPPLNNDEVGTNQAPNGGSFNGCASFTACGWATNPSCASIDTTTSYTGSDYSAKFLDCGSGNVTTLEFSNVAPGGYRQFIFSAYFKTDSAFNGAGIGMSVFDETHGGGAGPGTLTRQTGPVELVSNENISEITANSGWQQYSFAFSMDFAHVNDPHIQVRLQISGQTAGTIWMANPTIAPTWRGVSTFLIYPNYKGFLWSDLTPPERYSPGVSPVAGQIDGVTYVLPPQGDTLSGVTLTVKMATVGGCGSGVLATDTFSPPTGTQFWQFTPSQYGTLTAGTVYFLCTAVSGTYTDSDSDWETISEGSSFRTGLYNWVDPNGTIIHNGNAWFNLGSYDRYSGGRCSGVPTSYATILSSCAGNNPMTSTLPQATGAPGGTTGYIYSTKQASSLASDFPSQGLDSIIDFSQYSAVNPTFPSAPPGDELTARLEAANNFGWVHHQDWSYFYGCLTTATTTCTAPAFSPTVSTGTGTVTSNYLFLEWVAAAGAAPQGDSPTKLASLTLPSSPITVNLSSATCAGSNCSVTFTTPACYSTLQVGGLLYGAEGSTSTPPANTSFSRMFPTWTSTFPLTLGSSDYIPCNTSVTLSSFDTNAIAPPTTDTTSGGGPNWRGSITDTTLNQDFAAVLCSTSYPGGVGGYYIGDEFSYAAMPTIFYESQLINSNCSGNPTIGLDIGAGLTQYVCRIFDWCGSDPYGPLNVASPEEYAAAVTIPRNDSNFYSTGNTIVSTYDYPSRVDLYTEGVARDMYGSRPCWIVVRQYGVTTPVAANGFTYQGMGSQMWKAILGCQNWGDLGAGVMTWGEVDSTGLETSVYEYDNPQSYYDFQKIANEIKGLEPVLLTPVLDSSELSTGTGSVVSSTGWQLSSPSIISNVQIAAVGGGTTTLAAVCNIAGSGSYTSVWNNTSSYPMGPVRVVTHAYGLANTNLTDDYIFTTNLCDGTFQVTFGLPSVPAATKVLVKSNSTGTPYTLAISTSGCPNSQAACFTDTWTNNNDWHVYEIQAQRGVLIH